MNKHLWMICCHKCPRAYISMDFCTRTEMQAETKKRGWIRRIGGLWLCPTCAEQPKTERGELP